MDDYDDYCDLIDNDEETVVTFKDIKEEYETWLDCYEDVHDDVFFQPRWDKEVYAYAMLDEDQRKKFCNSPNPLTTSKKASPYFSNFCGPTPLSFPISSRV